jgi:hypothetical protein
VPQSNTESLLAAGLTFVPRVGYQFDKRLGLYVENCLSLGLAPVPSCEQCKFVSVLRLIGITASIIVQINAGRSFLFAAGPSVGGGYSLQTGGGFVVKVGAEVLARKRSTGPFVDALSIVLEARPLFIPNNFAGSGGIMIDMPVVLALGWEFYRGLISERAAAVPDAKSP